MKGSLLKAGLGAAFALSMGSVALAQTPATPGGQVPVATNKLESEARGFLTEAAESGHFEVAGRKNGAGKIAEHRGQAICAEDDWGR